ncbi:protein FATTY ACID EXPORT 1, chloroplastic-like isoform X1 [Musa acuminata AAA Group]|uniref:protein FATTY ACID EXPORT 1, chloroplastic-like isoform X1 n=2 Tax=Musa acuminata AAA Group TaxID=214697 RepID=UPI0031D15C00
MAEMPIVRVVHTAQEIVEARGRRAPNYPTFESAQSFSSPNTSAATVPLTHDRRLPSPLPGQLHRGASLPQATPRPAPPGCGFPTRGPPPATTAAAPSLVRLLLSLLGNQRPTALRDPRECTNLDISFRYSSMAVSQLYGSGLAAKWSMRSLEGLRPLPLWPRVASSGSPDLKSNYFKVPAIRVSNISGRKLTVSMGLNGSSPRSSIVANAATRYAEDKPDQADEPLKTNPTVKSINEKLDMDAHVQEEAVVPTKRSAKIHDFCFGIPFGGLLFAGGLVGFIFSRNATAMIYGGAILALSVLSLKVWRTGRSSLPFILGQAAFSAALLWKLLQAYSLSKKVFPTGLYIFFSAAMICFYSYVLISGGNPPPKKLAAAPPS